MKVEFSVSAIYDMRPEQRAINLEADMTAGQIQDAIIYLLGRTEIEQTMYEFMRAEFPDWFEN